MCLALSGASMTGNHAQSEAVAKPESQTVARGARMLRSALGPAIAHLLRDDRIIEVMLNPDGHIWVDLLSEGLADTGEILSAEDGERIIRLVAHHVGAEVHTRSPPCFGRTPGKW